MNGVAIFVAGVLADQIRGGLGSVGVRYMAAVAGGALFVGVALYMVFRERTPATKMATPFKALTRKL